MKIYGVEIEKVGKLVQCTYERRELQSGDFVIVVTSRGKVLGKIIKVFECEAYEGEDELCTIERVASEKDIKNNAELQEKANGLKPKIQELAKKENLEIKILEVNYTIDATKIIITFASEERVDFRTFVKKLASEYKVKIELKQIGSRDETKIVGGVGPCGRVCCCNSHMRDFKKVGIKMAKNQNISLNPSRINGLCGKLMCCLGYENSTYEEMGKTMPKIGSVVKTNDGDGVVMYNDILRQQCTVKFEESDEYKVYNVADIKFNKVNKEKNENN